MEEHSVCLYNVSFLGSAIPGWFPRCVTGITGCDGFRATGGCHFSSAIHTVTKVIAYFIHFRLVLGYRKFPEQCFTTVETVVCSLFPSSWLNHRATGFKFFHNSWSTSNCEFLVAWPVWTHPPTLSSLSLLELATTTTEGYLNQCG